ncbi:MAG: sigma 54-interacting transcriptional regulator [Victivallales bacterium]|nr:sigma 54-interacting transcriptional regulator [Victivallales bacterium]
MDLVFSCPSGAGRCDHVTELSALRDITGVMVSMSGQEEMLRCILDILEKRLDMFRGAIMLVDSDRKSLAVGALSDEFTEKNLAAVYRKGEGVIGQVFETGKSAIIPKVSEEPRFKARIYSRPGNIRKNTSFICVPISLNKETIGTLAVDMSFRSYECLKEHEQFLCIVAGLIAHDVHNRRLAHMEREMLEFENMRLKTALKDKFRPENIIGDSSSMRDVFIRIHQVAAVDTTVLIRGESGTGKELVASAIHYNSSRADKVFVRINCAALNENLLESELFGHEKGAFTGATCKRTGRIEEAEGGTLFLDEIGDFSPQVQVKLLRVIQERQYERVGSSQTLKANVRIIAATNRNLEEAIENNSFRQDLYYRINVFPIYLPPLRERKSDIMLLANHFVDKYAREMSKKVGRISSTAINMLSAYNWPGNVRELENCIEHAVLLCNDEVVQGHDLPQTLQMPLAISNSPAGSLKHQIEVMERDLISDSLKRNAGNVSAVARELGITGRMVRYKLEKMKLDPHRFSYRRYGK